jgi:prepilin-type N-terminal cleavage/methylation domain-containing protein
MHKISASPSGFSIPEVLIALVIVAVVGGGGWLTYKNVHHKTGTVSKTAVTTPSHSTKPAAKSTAPTPQQYLDITQWGVRLTLNSTTASLYYYINPQNPDVAYLSLKTISDVAPNCAADKTSLGAIYRLTDTEQQSATANPSALNQAGTIQIGNYWYGYDHAHGACTDGTAAMNAAVSAAAPNYSGSTLENTFTTLAAEPSNQ